MNFIVGGKHTHLIILPDQNTIVLDDNGLINAHPFHKKRSSDKKTPTPVNMASRGGTLFSELLTSGAQCLPRTMALKKFVRAARPRFLPTVTVGTYMCYVNSLDNFFSRTKNNRCRWLLTRGATTGQKLLSRKVQPV